MKNANWRVTAMMGLIAISLSAFSLSATAQKPLEIQVLGVSDTTIYLANYLGDKLFYNDTAQVDLFGNATFKGKPHDEGGKFAIVFPGQKRIDVLFTEEGGKMKTDITDPLGKMEILEGEENKLLYDYIKFITNMRSKRQPADAVLSDSLATEKDKADALATVERLNQSVTDHQKQLVADHGDTFFGKMINASLEVFVPEAPEGEAEPDIWRYQYYKSHFWDNFDFNDNRLVRDPSISRLLDKFLNKVVPQDPDSVCHFASEVIEKARGQQDLFQYVVQNGTHLTEKSKIMCMDKAFVCLVDKYFATGQTDWLTDEQLKKIIDAANDKRGVLCGNQMPNIILPNVTGDKWESLYDIDAELTVVLLWESSCGHCKKEMPKLKEIYEALKPEGVEFYAIGNDFETEDWVKFVKDKELKWINVSDNPEINEADSAAVLIRSGITTLPSLNFRSTFNITSTPQIFVLDKEKKLVGKGIGGDQLEDFLRRLLERNAIQEEN